MPNDIHIGKWDRFGAQVSKDLVHMVLEVVVSVVFFVLRVVPMVLLNGVDSAEIIEDNLRLAFTML